jgi:hypothetical protein
VRNVILHDVHGLSEWICLYCVRHGFINCERCTMPGFIVHRSLFTVHDVMPRTACLFHVPASIPGGSKKAGAED